MGFPQGFTAIAEGSCRSVGSTQCFDRGVAVPGLTPITVACRLPTPTLHMK